MSAELTADSQGFKVRTGRSKRAVARSSHPTAMNGTKWLSVVQGPTLQKTSGRWMRPKLGLKGKRKDVQLLVRKP